MYDHSNGRLPEIEEKLRAELEAAKGKYESTKHFDDWAATLIREAQPPGADSHYLAQQLIAQRSQATARLAQALKEFHEFILHGTIPERFKGDVA